MRPARLRCCIREGVCDSLFGHYAVKLNSLNLLWYGDHSTQAIHQDGQTVGHYHRLNAAWGLCRAGAPGEQSADIRPER